jgi:hypothetical protein
MRHAHLFSAVPLVALGLVAAQPGSAGAPPVMLDDTRDAAVKVCLEEAKSQLVKKGATDVKLKEVEDTDKKSNSRADARVLINVFSTDKNGKEKKKEMTFKCKTQNGIVTQIKIY